MNCTCDAINHDDPNPGEHVALFFTVRMQANLGARRGDETSFNMISLPWSPRCARTLTKRLLTLFTLGVMPSLYFANMEKPTSALLRLSACHS